MTEGSEGSEGDIFDQAITRREAQMLLPSLFPSFSLFSFYFSIFFTPITPGTGEQGGMLIMGRGKGGNDTVAPTKR